MDFTQMANNVLNANLVEKDNYGAINTMPISPT